MSRKKHFTAQIKGMEWKFYSQSLTAYEKAHGKDSDAVTYTHDMEVFFSKPRLLPGIVRHELFHVYIASSGINSAGLNTEQMEELCAELFEVHGLEMILLADKIIDFFMRLK